MVETFAARLRILMKGVQPYRWAKDVGIDKKYFKIFWGERRRPNQDTLIRIQKHTGCDTEWLLNGVGSDPYAKISPSIVKKKGSSPEEIAEKKRAHVEAIIDLANEFKVRKVLRNEGKLHIFNEKII